jgi:hypothetical protein
MAMMKLEKDFEPTIKQSKVETQSIGMSPEDIIHLLHTDAEYFINFFLGDELEYPVPQFHKDGWNLITMEAILYIALALPRGHAKTTLSKLCCVWYLLFTPTRFIVYVSNTANIAIEACQDIIKYMLSDNFQAIFGDLGFAIKREGHGYYKFEMRCPDGKGGFYKKFVILKALGAGQQVRGLNIDNTRPELAIVDDLEDNDNTATPMLQKKLKLWFFGAFMKAMSKKRRKLIYLGNMLSNQSILYSIVEKSPLWHSMRFGALVTYEEEFIHHITGERYTKTLLKPLWPEMWSIEEIQDDYLEFQRQGMVALWFAEMMNQPMAEGTALIDPSEIVYLPQVMPGEQKTAFITLDPAVSQKEWANDSALAVHAYVKDRWQIVEIVRGKFSLDQLFFLVVELCNKWNTRVLGIEKGAFEIGIKFIFEVLMKAHQQTFYCYAIPHKQRSKVERLAAWCSALKQKIWVLSEGDQEITHQLISFDPLKANNIDDVIDACSMGMTMTELYLPEIMEQYTIDPEQYAPKRVLPN